MMRKLEYPDQNTLRSVFDYDHITGHLIRKSATIEAAALAYNEAAVKHFGEFAYLNQVSQ